MARSARRRSPGARLVGWRSPRGVSRARRHQSPARRARRPSAQLHKRPSRRAGEPKADELAKLCAESPGAPFRASQAHAERAAVPSPQRSPAAGAAARRWGRRSRREPPFQATDFVSHPGHSAQRRRAGDFQRGAQGRKGVAPASFPRSFSRGDQPGPSPPTRAPPSLRDGRDR